MAGGVGGQRAAGGDHGLEGLAGGGAVGEPVHDLGVLAGGVVAGPAVGLALDADQPGPVGGQLGRPGGRARSRERRAATAVAAGVDLGLEPALALDHGGEGIEQALEAGPVGLERLEHLGQRLDGRQAEVGGLAADEVVARAARAEGDARQGGERGVEAQQLARLPPGAVEHDQRDRAVARAAGRPAGRRGRGTGRRAGAGSRSRPRTTGSAAKSTPTRSTEPGSARWAMRAVPMPTRRSRACCSSSTRVRVGRTVMRAQKQTPGGRRQPGSTGAGRPGSAGSAGGGRRGWRGRWQRSTVRARARRHMRRREVDADGVEAERVGHREHGAPAAERIDHPAGGGLVDG